ncbi:MAG TPA: 5-oxoprolinase subunit PxpB [Chitinophagaceae bacterium]|nr:5-oxoprolinase subunit PxpB [Chitinophagaceae bacterium]
MKSPLDQLPPYRFSPLGDNAIIIDFGNIIDEQINKLVHSVFYQLQNDPVPGMIEAVPAYCSLTIFYDVFFISNQAGNQNVTVFEWVCERLKTYMSNQNFETGDPELLIDIPVCYDKEFGTDLDFIAAQNEIAVEEIIQLHSSAIYRVYMLGFLPGFAYMGLVNEKISSPRKQQPTPVEAGSVGIAGRQTGIYPFRSPGGWRIIGRTPLKLFNKEKVNPVLFKSGDHVKFHSITIDEFNFLKNNRSSSLREG